jgi:RNA polymerase sigma factor (sigma-70 family)
LHRVGTRKDLDALGALVDRHLEVIYGFFHRLAGSPQQAAQWTEGFFVAVIQKSGFFSKEDTPFQWLFRLAAATALDKLKSSTLRQARLLVNRKKKDESVPKSQGDSEPSADSMPAESDRLGFQEAFEKLKPNYRVAFLLFVCQGFSYADIGYIMQVDPSSARQWVHRARQQMASILDPEASTP